MAPAAGVNPARPARKRHDARAEGSLATEELAFGNNMKAPVRPPAPPPLPPSAAGDPNAKRIAEILDDLGRAGPGYENIQLAPLKALGARGIDALVAAFPGLPWFDRRLPHQKVPRGRDVSPIASLLYQLYPASGSAVVTLLESDDADIRYYAMMLAADIGDAALLDAVARRLFDTDTSVVRLALQVIEKVGGPEFAQRVGDELAGAITAFDSGWARRMRAIELIGATRNARGVPALIACLGLGDATLAAAAERALRLLTAHDFGARTKEWEAWLRVNRSRPRVEWLLDALTSDEVQLRDHAASELALACGNDGGYVPGCDAKSAKAARSRFERAIRR